MCNTSSRDFIEHIDPETYKKGELPHLVTTEITIPANIYHYSCQQMAVIKSNKPPHSWSGWKAYINFIEDITKHTINKEKGNLVSSIPLI